MAKAHFGMKCKQTNFARQLNETVTSISRVKEATELTVCHEHFFSISKLNVNLDIKVTLREKQSSRKKIK